jgi:hypothetical protein
MTLSFFIGLFSNFGTLYKKAHGMCSREGHKKGRYYNRPVIKYNHAKVRFLIRSVII